MFDETETIQGFDEELSEALQGERRRQEEHIELIGSENFASPRVLAAQGSVLTNKYAEGYPGRRYYGGCEFVDVAETSGDRAGEVVCSGPISPTSSLIRDPRPTSRRTWR